VEFGLVYIKKKHTVYIHLNPRLFFLKEKLVALKKIGAATFVVKMEIIEVISKGKILPYTFSLSGKACDNLPMGAINN
jgi:hypothetical protein